MNKAELVKALSEKAGVTQKDAEKVVAALVETVTETLTAGDKVQLIGFGTFETTVRKARTGRNPQTGKAMKFPKKTVPTFKAGAALKNAVNK